LLALPSLPHFSGPAIDEICLQIDNRAIHESKDTEAQERYREAVRKIQVSRNSITNTAISAATLAGLGKVKSEEAWPARVENEQRINGYTPRQGGQVAFLLETLPLGFGGIRLLDQSVKVGASGEVVGTPLSMAGRIISSKRSRSPPDFGHDVIS